MRWVRGGDLVKWHIQGASLDWVIEVPGPHILSFPLKKKVEAVKSVTAAGAHMQHRIQGLRLNRPHARVKPFFFFFFLTD